MATEAELQAQLASVRQQMLMVESTQYGDRSTKTRSMDELVTLEGRLNSQLSALRSRPKQSIGVASKGL